MTVPVLIQAGAGVEGADNSTISILGCKEGNILVLQTFNPGDGTQFVFADTLVNCTGLPGLSSLGHPSTTPVGSPTLGNTDYFLGKVTADGTCSVKVQLTGAATNPVYARFYELAQVYKSNRWQDIVDDSAGGEVGTSTTITDENITTTGRVPTGSCLAIQLVAVNAALAVSPFTGETGGDWIEAVAPFTGSAGTLQIQTSTIPLAATIDGGTMTISPSTAWGVLGFALLPSVDPIPPISIPTRATAW